MDKVDKIERAVIELGGKWPEKEKAQGVLLFCKKDHYCDGEGGCYRGKYYAGTKLYDKELFEGICTYPEFMEARKRLEDRKVDKIDWSKAPEGATHAGRRPSGRACWYKNIRETSYEFFHIFDDDWKTNRGTPENQPLEPRPQPDHKEGVEWDGESNPPVGIKCRAKWLVPPDGGDMGFIGVKVVAYDEGQFNVWLKTSYGNELLPVSQCVFEAKKSHRDKVIEAALQIIVDADELAEKGLRASLEDLYDAGALKLTGDEQ